MYNSDRDKLLIILGMVYEYGMGGPFAGPEAKARVLAQGLGELVEFLDIEFDEDGDIVSICGAGMLWYTGERPEDE